MEFPWLEAHGGVTHFPVALLIAALVFDAGGALFRKTEWRTVGFWLLVGGVLMAVPSLFTGWMTARHLFGGSGRPPAEFALHWRMALLTTVLATGYLGLRLARRDAASPNRSMGTLALGLFTAMAVGFTGYLGGDMALSDAGQAQTAAGSAGPAGGGNVEAVARNRRVFAPDLVSRGHKLVIDEEVGCRGCHVVDGAGGRMGPDLSRIGLQQPDIAWQMEHLRDPRSVRPGSSMPSFASLSAEDRLAIAAWLVTRDGSGP